MTTCIIPAHEEWWTVSSRIIVQSRTSTLQSLHLTLIFLIYYHAVQLFRYSNVAVVSQSGIGTIASRVSCMEVYSA